MFLFLKARYHTLIKIGVQEWSSGPLPSQAWCFLMPDACDTVRTENHDHSLGIFKKIYPR